MHEILNILYEKEILLSKLLDSELNYNNSKNEIIFKIITKLNILHKDLSRILDDNINDLLFSTNNLKYIKIKKFVTLGEYINEYILNLKYQFKESINVYFNEKLSNNFSHNLYDKLNNLIDLSNYSNNITDSNNINDSNNIIQNVDKFYTNLHIVSECINNFNLFYNINNFDLVIEPSAGSGNFLLNINHENKIGIDIEPEHESIVKKDFFEYYPETDIYTNILTIGNPPFGRVCSLAIKFFNHAAQFSNVIAFIIPRSFRKESIQNKLDTNFKLIYDIDISNKSNTFDPPINVKCCFQIWIKNNEKRLIIKRSIKHKDWVFLNYKKDDINKCDFAIRAYGGDCGKIIDANFNTINCKGCHFIKSNINIDKLKSNFNDLDFKHSKNTARQNSLGKAELVELYTKKYNLI